MRLYINNHSFHYECENLVRVFFPNLKITVEREQKALIAPYVATTVTNSEIIVTVKIDEFEQTLTAPKQDSDAKNEIAMAQMIYKLLCSQSGADQPWGILTGVRPIKLIKSLRETYGNKKAGDYFINSLYVTPQRTSLAMHTERNQRAIVDSSGNNSFSLYISIPFCPGRCNYCSFVSQSIEAAKHLMLPYTDLLCKEIKKTGKIAAQYGLKLQTVYIGGGTPTSLEDAYLAKILQAVNDNFDMVACREFTVEAGRPDTITQEKLQILKNAGVDRISINPQTLNDELLEKIGRNHTAQQFFDSYALARQIGFKAINVDLIAGLTDDTYENFCSTFDQIANLNPENITIHTLCLKRSSTLAESHLQLQRESAALCGKMLDYAAKQLKQTNYYPYYLYRQSRMVGNFENTGYCRQRHEGLYNIFIMDETHTILSCGAGAVTKIKDPKTGNIERIFNFKYPYEYINRYAQMLERKDEAAEFFEKLQAEQGNTSVFE
ncbi:MAG: coproporphyrinogen dehydrogenase HemZ [Oscillospiraceae bacterium]|jgi:oxygen-independent coproporphyrinogen-3 oxidase|nr:coproporphyrinogen dehydrogenase HemZ [Oscillospiraceae bacterium]